MGSDTNCKEAGFQFNAERADWRDDTDDEPDDQELESHYMMMNELARERDLLASLIEKLKCEIDESKNRNKFLESSNKALVDKLKGEIEDFKTKNKCLESSNNHFKEANNEPSKTNQLMFKDLKKFQAELDRTRQPIAMPISTREPKRTVNQSVATPLKRTVASKSTNQKPRSKLRKQYEQIRNKSRTTTISEPTNFKKSTVSNTPSSSNSFPARRDNSIHHRLWVLKAHDGKSQAY
ncbi:hypothetical protein Tco_1253795 [Tanacetum coccineum]